MNSKQPIRSAAGIHRGAVQSSSKSPATGAGEVKAGPTTTHGDGGFLSSVAMRSSHGPARGRRASPGRRDRMTAPGTTSSPRAGKRRPTVRLDPSSARAGPRCRTARLPRCDQSLPRFPSLARPVWQSEGTGAAPRSSESRWTRRRREAAPPRRAGDPTSRPGAERPPCGGPAPGGRTVATEC